MLRTLDLLEDGEDEKVSDVIPLDKLISKYEQITKLAAKYHEGWDEQGIQKSRSTSSKNAREQVVLHYLLELKRLREERKT